MEKFARLAHFTQFKIIDITRPYSFFNFEEANFPGLDSLKRILSQIRQLGGKTFIFEKIELSIDQQEENEDIQIVYPTFELSQSFRLSFFSVKFSDESEIKNVPCDSFLGYAIIKKDEHPKIIRSARVFESIIALSRHSNNYVHGARDWLVRVLDQTFTIEGYLYAQQNAITNVCANVAIRSVVSKYHPDGDITYREMNNIAGIDHINKTATPGLQIEDMLQMLEDNGINYFVGDFSEPDDFPVTFQKYIYSSIESGFPAIVCFGFKNLYHAIPVFGHTFNEDTWVPNADFSYFQIGQQTRYISSESWMSMFIGHDDNFGSNFCIPRRYLSTPTVCRHANSGPPEFCLNDIEGVVYVIGTIPKEVKTNPIEAEAIGADYLFMILNHILDANKRWCHRLQAYARINRLVLRPSLITLDGYISHLSKIKDWENNHISHDIVEPIKEFIDEGYYWLIELSVPELYQANRRKIGEILLRSDIELNYERDYCEFVIARIPDRFVLYMGKNDNTPQFQFIPTGLESHVELYGTEEQ